MKRKTQTNLSLTEEDYRVALGRPLHFNMNSRVSAPPTAAGTGNVTPLVRGTAPPSSYIHSHYAYTTTPPIQLAVQCEGGAETVFRPPYLGPTSERGRFFNTRIDRGIVKGPLGQGEVVGGISSTNTPSSEAVATFSFTPSSPSSIAAGARRSSSASGQRAGSVGDGGGVTAALAPMPMIPPTASAPLSNTLNDYQYEELMKQYYLSSTTGATEPSFQQQQQRHASSSSFHHNHTSSLLHSMQSLQRSAAAAVGSAATHLPSASPLASPLTSSNVSSVRAAAEAALRTLTTTTNNNTIAAADAAGHGDGHDEEEAVTAAEEADDLSPCGSPRTRRGLYEREGGGAQGARRDGAGSNSNNTNMNTAATAKNTTNSPLRRSNSGSTAHTHQNNHPNRISLANRAAITHQQQREARAAAAAAFEAKRAEEIKRAEELKRIEREIRTRGGTTMFTTVPEPFSASVSKPTISHQIAPVMRAEQRALEKSKQLRAKTPPTSAATATTATTTTTPKKASSSFSSNAITASVGVRGDTVSTPKRRTASSSAAAVGGKGGGGGPASLYENPIERLKRLAEEAEQKRNLYYAAVEEQRRQKQQANRSSSKAKSSFVPQQQDTPSTFVNNNASTTRNASGDGEAVGVACVGSGGAANTATSQRIATTDCEAATSASQQDERHADPSPQHQHHQQHEHHRYLSPSLPLLLYAASALPHHHHQLRENTSVKVSRSPSPPTNNNNTTSSSSSSSSASNSAMRLLPWARMAEALFIVTSVYEKTTVISSSTSSPPPEGGRATTRSSTLDKLRHLFQTSDFSYDMDKGKADVLFRRSSSREAHHNNTSNNGAANHSFQSTSSTAADGADGAGDFTTATNPCSVDDPSSTPIPSRPRSPFVIPIVHTRALATQLLSAYAGRERQLFRLLAKKHLSPSTSSSSSGRRGGGEKSGAGGVLTAVIAEATEELRRLKAIHTAVLRRNGSSGVNGVDDGSGDDVDAFIGWNPTKELHIADFVLSIMLSPNQYGALLQALLTARRVKEKALAVEELAAKEEARKRGGGGGNTNASHDPFAHENSSNATTSRGGIGLASNDPNDASGQADDCTAESDDHFNNNHRHHHQQQQPSYLAPTIASQVKATVVANTAASQIKPRTQTPTRTATTTSNNANNVSSPSSAAAPSSSSYHRTVSSSGYGKVPPRSPSYLVNMQQATNYSTACAIRGGVPAATSATTPRRRDGARNTSADAPTTALPTRRGDDDSAAAMKPSIYSPFSSARQQHNEGVPFSHASAPAAASSTTTTNASANPSSSSSFPFQLSRVYKLTLPASIPEVLPTPEQLGMLPKRGSGDALLNTNGSGDGRYYQSSTRLLAQRFGGLVRRQHEQQKQEEDDEELPHQEHTAEEAHEEEPLAAADNGYGRCGKSPSPDIEGCFEVEGSEEAQRLNSADYGEGVAAFAYATNINALVHEEDEVGQKEGSLPAGYWASQYEGSLAPGMWATASNGGDAAVMGGVVPL